MEFCHKFINFFLKIYHFTLSLFFRSLLFFVCMSLYSFDLQPRSSDKKSELLPADWSSNKELYSLRYKDNNSDTQMLLKAITVDSAQIFNLMVGTPIRE